LLRHFCLLIEAILLAVGRHRMASPEIYIELVYFFNKLFASDFIRTMEKYKFNYNDADDEDHRS
jgi:hypothetical protein